MNHARTVCVLSRDSNSCMAWKATRSLSSDSRRALPPSLQRVTVFTLHVTRHEGNEARPEHLHKRLDDIGERRLSSLSMSRLYRRAS